MVDRAFFGVDGGGDGVEAEVFVGEHCDFVVAGVREVGVVK